MEITSDQGNCRKLDSPLVLVLALMADSELLEEPPSETKPVAKPWAAAFAAQNG